MQQKKKMPFRLLAVARWRRHCLCLINIAASSLLAFPGQPRFVHLTIDHGLSHSKVNCILQDHRGFLWIGTNEGLCRYDGVGFTPFRYQPIDPMGIAAPLVRAILEDSLGRIWIGTENGGLDCLDPTINRIEHFSTAADTAPLTPVDVNAILQDEGGGLWLATSRGLDFVDVASKQVITYVPPSLENEPLRARVLNVILDGRDGCLWLGALHSGLWCFDRQKRTFNVFQHDPRNPLSLGDNDIRALYLDSQSRLWIGTNVGGLNLFHAQTKTFTRFHLNPKNSESTTIRALLEDGPDHLLVGNRSGLYRFHPKSGQYTQYEHDPNDPYSLSHNSIQCFYRDSCGDLWIGTRDGLNYLNKQNHNFKHYQARSNDRRFLNNKVVYGILQDREGDIWFATEEGGINRLHRDSGLFTYYKHDPMNPHSLSVNNIKTLVQDRQGQIWAGTFRGGLNVLDLRSGRFTGIRHNPRDPFSPASNDIMVLLLDREGDIWVGTTDAGLDRYQWTTHRFCHWPMPKDSPAFTSITALMQDRNGKIWIGSSHGRLASLDKKTGDFHEYRLVENDAAAIEVRVIHQDASANLWIGTWGSGLFHLDLGSGNIRRYGDQDGLPGHVILGILRDAKQNLWLSTTEGLVCFQPRTGECVTYTKENGLQSNQFCYNAYLCSREGQLYFGGINGVTIIDPQSLQRNTFVPPVVLTGLRVNNKPVEIGSADGLLKKSITDTDQLTLSHRHAVFSVEFAALSYAISSKNRYKYMLEGFDPDWNDAGHQRVATYTNLNPGNYTLRVQAANSDGVWNEIGSTLHIIIKPPLWKTWWAKILGLISIGFIIRHLIAYQVQKKNYFQATSLANLAQLKLLRYQMNPHFLFNAHNSIRSMILIDKERAWQMITEMSEFFRYTLLNFNKLEDTLDEEISAVNNYLNIEKVRYRDSLEVSFHIEDAARNYTVPSFLFQPLIENAIQYGMRTSPMPLQVKVWITSQNNQLSIDVSNTGHLLEKQWTGGDPEVHGTSLENIKQRLEIMFKNRYEFRLYQEAGWVHAKIRIRYPDSDHSHAVVSG